MIAKHFPFVPAAPENETVDESPIAVSCDAGVTIADVQVTRLVRAKRLVIEDGGVGADHDNLRAASRRWSAR